jgi:hypothetical protein
MAPEAAITHRRLLHRVRAQSGNTWDIGTEAQVDVQTAWREQDCKWQAHPWLPRLILSFDTDTSSLLSSHLHTSPLTIVCHYSHSDHGGRSADNQPQDPFTLD